MGILSPHRLSAGCGLELSSYKYLNSHHLLCIRLFDLQMTENLIQIGLSREKKKKTSLAWEQQYVRLDLTSDCLDTGAKIMQGRPILPSSFPSAFFIGFIHSSVGKWLGSLELQTSILHVHI